MDFLSLLRLHCCHIACAARASCGAQTLVLQEKRPLQASVVQQYLAAGACPSISQNGASALLLILFCSYLVVSSYSCPCVLYGACCAYIVRMVLNPYSSYEEMVPICRMVLQKSPQVVCQRDGFKLSPLEPRLIDKSARQ